MDFKKIISFLRSHTLAALLANLGIAVGILLVVSVFFFYIYLPGTTNHGKEVQVPDLTGKDIYEIDKLLTPLRLRYEVGDSSYSADLPPLTVLAQVPKAGHFVKEHRKIYLTVNRKSPPTLPLPNLFGEGGAGSLENAEAVLKSAELVRGRIIYRRSPNYHLVMEIRYNGRVILPGTRVPKGSTIDLVVGDGAGPRDFVLSNFVGLAYKNVLLRLANLSLHLGTVQIPDDVDTTGIEAFVIKQYPEPGDSVSIGDPVELWIGPKGYQIKDQQDN
ncbi:MAG: PASTA domain-containing protein [Cyclobacteriaceae bacterium]|nr:PASTA domain-containing protein [Cyclobacteriaceae bacterium]